MGSFKFDIGQAVELAMSGERGVVVVRAEYDANERSYYVRYKAADGRQVESWWGQSALKAAAA